jgi:hypothetical protein
MDDLDSKVMLVAEYLRSCGMSPLDRALWAEQHGWRYSAGGLQRWLRSLRLIQAEKLPCFLRPQAGEPR